MTLANLQRLIKVVDRKISFFFSQQSYVLSSTHTQEQRTELEPSLRAQINELEGLLLALNIATKDAYLREERSRLAP